MASSIMLKSSLLLCIAVVCMVVLWAPHAAEAQAPQVTCGSIVKTLNPCMTYLKSRGGTPPAACCNAVKQLKGMAQAPGDRKTACVCLKNTAAKMKGLNLGTANRLPNACGVTIRYAISPNTNCDSVQ